MASFSCAKKARDCDLWLAKALPALSGALVPPPATVLTSTTVSLWRAVRASFQ